MIGFLPSSWFFWAVLAQAFADDQIPISLETPSLIPSIGFGTWRLDKSNASEAVSIALQTGYRHIDCAAIYGNEKQVGRGIKDGLMKSGTARADIWITSKLWNDRHAPDQVESALDKTLRDLKLDYLDLYLMHWPVASNSGKNTIDFIDTWHAMEALLDTGKVRNIGISNFSPHQISSLIDASTIKPAVHQFELHPYLQQSDFLTWHKDNGISVTAYSPLANLNPIYNAKDGAGGTTDDLPSLLANKEISAIAEQRGCTNAQVALAWGMGRGTSVIPKSQHEDRIRENLAAKNCRLEAEDLKIIEKVGSTYLHRLNNPAEDWGVRLYEGLDDA